MKNIFLSPHSDDEALFGSYVIQRMKPTIIVCTDGTSHEKKFNIPTKTRRDESIQAARILGVDVEFLGIAEEELTEDSLEKKLLGVTADFVFAPALQGGNPHHDIVSKVASLLWKRVMYYSSYAKNDLTLTGEMPLTPTDVELAKKNLALLCYHSQRKINAHHFEAVTHEPEYLSFKP